MAKIDKIRHEYIRETAYVKCFKIITGKDFEVVSTQEMVVNMLVKRGLG